MVLPFTYISVFTGSKSVIIKKFLWQFFNNVLMMNKGQNSEVAKKVYDLVYELNLIVSSVLVSVLPQLEFKLKVSELTFIVCRRTHYKIIKGQHKNVHV